LAVEIQPVLLREMATNLKELQEMQRLLI